jgi:hypothetical protein
MAEEFKFEVVDARKSLEDIQEELRTKIQQLLTEEGLARKTAVMSDRPDEHTHSPDLVT